MKKGKFTYLKESLFNKNNINIKDIKALFSLKESVFVPDEFNDNIDISIDDTSKNTNQLIFKSLYKKMLPKFYSAIFSDEGWKLLDDIFPVIPDWPGFGNRALRINSDIRGFANCLFIDTCEDLGLDKDSCAQLTVFLKSLTDQLLEIYCDDKISKSGNTIQYNYVIDHSEYFETMFLGSNIQNLVDVFKETNCFSKVTNTSFLHSVCSRILEIFVVKKLLTKDVANQIMKSINWYESKINFSFDFDYRNLGDSDADNYFKYIYGTAESPNKIDEDILKNIKNVRKYFDFSGINIPVAGDELINYPQLYYNIDYHDIISNNYINLTNYLNKHLLKAINYYVKLLEILTNSNSVGLMVMLNISDEYKLNINLVSQIVKKFRQRIYNTFSSKHDIIFFGSKKEAEEFWDDYAGAI